MLNFIRLIRPINIVIIFLTMYALRFFYTDLQSNAPTTSLFERIDFFLLVSSILLIAAGGNIINDYFDVKADRVNKPHKLIITKYIKQRWAIISHWFFNGLALIIGSYLSIKYQTFSFIFIYLICINALWFYSVYFKRKALIGNILVAILTASVPLTCGLYFNIIGLSSNSIQRLDFNWIDYLAASNKLIFAMAIFAFLLNFGREIVKDIQDSKGDLLIHAKTLPILIGEKKTKNLGALVLIFIPIILLIFFLIKKQNLVNNTVFFLPLLFVFILVMFSVILLLFTNKIKLVDRILKIAMFIGLMLPYYWYFIQ
jgi:4-hydroxybenzoate polyprenyltransferase